MASPSAVAPATAVGAVPAAATNLSGQITVYTASPDDLAKNMAQAFTQQTGVQVNLLSADTGTVLSRLQAEESHPQADVVILADWSAGLSLAQQGLVLAYQAPGAQEVPAAYQAPDQSFVAQGMSATTIVYNTDKVTTPPQDWDDLLQPAWKDQVTMPDPAASGTAYDFLATFLEQRGEDAGWQYLTQMKADGLIVPGSNATALNPVTSGGRSAMVAAVDHTTYASIAQGEHLKMVYPKSGTSLSPRPLLIMKSTKNPDAAKAFVDFSLSTQGQQIVASSWVIPARSDVPVRDGHTPLSEITAWPSDWNWEAQNRTDVLNRFSQQIAQ